jgi:hypothetical protein
MSACARPNCGQIASNIADRIAGDSAGIQVREACRFSKPATRVPALTVGRGCQVFLRFAPLHADFGSLRACRSL